MKSIRQTISDQAAAPLSSCLASPENALFFDLETTGFSPKSACIYLIGACVLKQGSWQLYQWMAENPSEEKAMLQAFLSFAAPFSRWIHFNGTAFDLPFLQARCKKNALQMPELPLSEDIFRAVSSYKNVLHLSGCKQRDLEQFLGLFREDPFTGGQLIELYHSYSEAPDERLLQTLLLHNAEDLSGMLAIYPMTAYHRLFLGDLTVVSAEKQTYPDSQGNPLRELLLTLRFQTPLPKPLAFHGSLLPKEKEKKETQPLQCFFSGKEETGLLKIPFWEGEGKYFYPDYKNYAYLPAEDRAIHKSAAVYVDKAYRRPATAATCYIRKSGSFLPFPDPLLLEDPASSAFSNLPLFRKAWAEKQHFFLPEESFFARPELLTVYAAAVLRAMV